MRKAFPFVLLAFVVGCSSRLDENLCPRDKEPSRTTILLVDTSDPLNEKQRSVFARLVREMQTPAPEADGSHHVAPGEALAVYELPRQFANVEPVLFVCNPGDPDDWPWWRELVEGKLLAHAKWLKFQDRVSPLFAAAQPAAAPRSPIVEFLGVVVPRHAPSLRARPAARGRAASTHLIVYSDLLQHSDSLSHYGAYPDADAITRTDGLRHLGTDLSGVDVSLYRLERSRDGRWQTTEHYYWWTNLVEAFGGTLIWQESI